MAQISLDSLIEVIKESSEYKNKLEMEVPAEQALYIKISNPKEDVRPINSSDFELSDGSTLILDIGKDGVVYGMEIC